MLALSAVNSPLKWSWIILPIVPVAIYITLEFHPGATTARNKITRFLVSVIMFCATIKPFYESFVDPYFNQYTQESQFTTVSSVVLIYQLAYFFFIYQILGWFTRREKTQIF